MRRILSAFALGLGAAIVLALVSLAAQRAFGSEPYPAWLEAFSTLAAFSAATVAAWFAIAAFRLESQRELRWLEAQESAQASLVAAWWGVGRHYVGRIGGGESPSIEEGLWFRNASEVPVTSVVIGVQLMGGDVKPVLDLEMELGTLGPSSEPQLARMVPRMREAVDRVRERLPPGGDLFGNVQISMRFQDAAGRTWQRSHGRRLTRVPDDWLAQTPQRADGRRLTTPLS